MNGACGRPRCSSRPVSSAYMGIRGVAAQPQARRQAWSSWRWSACRGRVRAASAAAAVCGVPGPAMLIAGSLAQTAVNACSRRTDVLRRLSREHRQDVEVSRARARNDAAWQSKRWSRRAATKRSRTTTAPDPPVRRSPRCRAPRHRKIAVVGPDRHAFGRTRQRQRAIARTTRHRVPNRRERESLVPRDCSTPDRFRERPR